MLLRGENMIKTHDIMIQELKKYKAPGNKLSRMIKTETITPIIRGLYETEKNMPGYLLAGSIYGPSYLSFDFALSHYGLIPEAVYVFTSATFEKKKAKKFTTPFGTFIYRDVPSSVYPLGIEIKKEGAYAYAIASPEKALCDKLYSIPPIKSKKELQHLLFTDLRIDENEFIKLCHEDLLILCELYHCTNLKILAKLLRGSST